MVIQRYKMSLFVMLMIKRDKHKVLIKEFKKKKKSRMFSLTHQKPDIVQESLTKVIFVLQEYFLVRKISGVILIGPCLC